MKINVQGAATEKLRNLFNEHGGDRDKVYAAMKADWNMLLKDATDRDAVQNSNTFSSNLTTNFLILGATTQASPKFAAVPMFARAINPDPYKPLATGEAKYNVTSQNGTTTQVNATNFESGDSTVNAVSITTSQYTEAFHITNSDLNSGLRMTDLVTAKINSLGSKITQVLTSNITAANFATLAPVIRSFGAFGFSDTQTILSTIAKANRKNCMLAPGYLYKLTNVPSLYQPTPVIPGAAWKNLVGFDYLAENTEWSQAGANINGFACDPQALAVIAGLPLLDSPGIPGGILAQATGKMTGVDLDLAVYTWFNTSTRTYWGSFDLIFGASPLDTTIGMVIATGTPS